MTAREANSKGLCDKCKGNFTFCEELNDNTCCLIEAQIEELQNDEGTAETSK